MYCENCGKLTGCHDRICEKWCRACAWQLIEIEDREFEERQKRRVISPYATAKALFEEAATTKGSE